MDWNKLEKEFRDLYKSREKPERQEELKQLALANNREFVTYGTIAYLVEEELPADA
jgi:hypothetical protein